MNLLYGGQTTEPVGAEDLPSLFFFYLFIYFFGQLTLTWQSTHQVACENPDRQSARLRDPWGLHTTASDVVRPDFVIIFFS